jgi:uncharacterized protein YdhG (YjbR/CyaY superfamily)
VANEASVEDYFSRVPPHARATLDKLRNTITAAAPDTVEVISYQMPTFKYRGRALVGIAAFKNHCSIFPYSTGVMEILSEDLEPYEKSKGTIRFPIGEPPPATLIEKIVRIRKEEIEGRRRS